MKNLIISLDGQDKNISAEVIDKKIWFKIDEQIYSYDLIDLAEGSYKKAKGSGKSADRIMAPMPGKVTKIFVNEGQNVKKGDTLLVMEAMKMEYTLKSDLDALVDKINTKLGDQVTLGALLVQLKENK